MQVKKERLESIIKKNISEILSLEIRDPDIGFATITDVILNNDYSIAKVYVTFLDKVDKSEFRLNALNRAKGLIKSKLAKTLSIRKCPDLHFMIDNSLSEGNYIESLINKVNK